MPKNSSRGTTPKSTRAPTGSTSRDEKILKKLYAQGPAAYGSVKSLQQASGQSRKKVTRFLQAQNAYTKYRSPRKKFQRLKVIALRINEIWSMDLAYVDKLSNYNKDVKYLLVAVDVLSRFVRVQPMTNKSAPTTAKAFAKMLSGGGGGKRGRVVKPEKVWTDKGTEFKGAFQLLCDKKGIHTYTTNSETKSSFAERNIRSLKNIMYKYLEDKWTYTYLSNLQDFVKTINGRVNRVTQLAPSKVSKRHVPHLLSLAVPRTRLRQPKLKVGDWVRIAKEDMPFRKGYKQNFTDELFEVTGILTRNPVTYGLTDSAGDAILGKFYESELSRVVINV